MDIGSSPGSSAYLDDHRQITSEAFIPRVPDEWVGQVYLHGLWFIGH